jgi:hypothetical protein
VKILGLKLGPLGLRIIIIVQVVSLREFLDYNRIDHKSPADVIGLEFPTVTLVISGKSAVGVRRAEFYICCTRTTGKLLIITPDPEEFHNCSNAIDSTS